MRSGSLRDSGGGVGSAGYRVLGVFGTIMRNRLIALTIPLLLSLPSMASETDGFTYLFARTCMKDFYTPEKLKSEMEGNQILDGKAAEFFLGGAKGTAWAVNDGGAKYVVAYRKDNVCAVFAQQADIDDVARNFANSVGKAPPPLEAIERAGRGPNSESLKTISYAWTREQDETELLFTLTTSSDENSPVKAMASVAIVTK